MVPIRDDVIRLTFKLARRKRASIGSRPILCFFFFFLTEVEDVFKLALASNQEQSFQFIRGKKKKDYHLKFRVFQKCTQDLF